MEMSYEQFENWEKELYDYVRNEKILEEPSPEVENGSLANTLKQLDLENSEDLKSMYKIAKVSDWERGRVLNSDGSLFFGNRKIETNMLYPMRVNYLLPSMPELPLDIKLHENGHELVKISNALKYWAPSWREQKLHKEVFKIPSKDDTNKVLATLMASSELASQSLNRYDTGLFLGFNPDSLNNPELNELVHSHQEMYTQWNDVFLKYFSKIIQKEPVNISQKSLKGLEELCLNIPEQPADPSEFTSILNQERGLMKKMKEFEEYPEKYLDQIKAKAKKTYGMVKRFTGYLNGIGSEMSYAKPK